MKKMFLPLLVPTLLGVSACTPNNDSASQDQSAKKEMPVASNFDSVYNNISDADIREPLKVLSSDEFEGRLPTTEGEKKTIEYLVSEFTKAGLKPGNGDSFLQKVALMEITADPDMTMTIGDNNFAYKEQMVASSKREQSSVSLEDSELVFVGYGVNAPEYDWNDYEGLDVEGKTVVMLINDPGFENPESGKFQGTTMTYYGRWSYKYEEASRQGAAGAIIVHETAPASYGWSVVANSWSGPQYGLVSADKGASRVAVEGWLTLDAAKKVFADAGLDFDQEKANAMQGPYNKAMDIKASVTVNNTFKKSESNNVIATLPGAEFPDEHIIYTAHWDHLGKDESKEGDQIYNGAHDNATGTAAILAMAKAYSELTPAPKRSVSFLVVTAEEQGLLGSKYYASNPVIPIENTVANINMDAMNVLGKTKNVAVVGMGKSEMEDYLEAAAAKQGRTLTQEDRPEAGYYYRSDHFSFAKQGVPALYAEGGNEPADEETAKYRKRMNVIVTGCYHQVCDQYRDDWDLSGIVQDTQMLFDVGVGVANAEAWPKWNEASEFQRQN
ncbi:Peptidase M28 [Alteromonas macleodii]|jgi:Zn-dependent M28 family amino/carboxypeptidase|uniref:Glutamate carboxypeptidase II n=1 Tax=Alteromonas macleodii (strain English Channel 673) TaxID=1004788 RepID=A0AB32ZWD3_ALTME|nr:MULTISPECIES: M28 family metallopeptidase [Alteromonas]MEC7480650.1 M28 family metallopeptidase [Pseudomonadota bacterium]AFT73852.1 putative Glutamate carboxypeptidase II [Alteromonas macleodii str. 'English Channel 673']AUI81867.1 peptidase M28 [Alteromonas macleodii]KHT59196.1 peptidase M28 [Alteromonas macleodii]MBC6983860.1 M28 family peptidase [Alteromonas sp. BZK5]|tara:strand:- start:347 stop:2014 length:1668 start_codon:yes stop_codon:yes gene_type:complete